MEDVTACEIELERIGENRVGRDVGAEQALLFPIGFHQLDQVAGRDC